MTTLSIVIPTFNTAAMTLRCCRAALAALPADGEVIVVDDASTDGTAELLRAEVPRVVVVRLATNQRFAAAANAGVAASRGEIVLLLNSDTTIAADAATALLAAFDADRELGIAGARLLNPNSTLQWSGGALPTLPWLLVAVSGAARFVPRRRARRSSGGVEWVSGAAMAIRRRTWEEVGPLREDFRFYAQDLDFCARAGGRGWRVRIIEAARVLHEGGVTMRSWREGVDLPHDPRLLWPDLLQWGRGHYGRNWARVARASMSLAVLLRVVWRRSLELLLRGERRRRARSSTNAFAAALQQLFVEREESAREDVGGVAAGDEAARGVADRERT